MSAIALSVNLNKVALIRNSREGNYPDLATFAHLCVDAGVQGLTVHPRPDQRHIRPADVKALAAIAASAKGVEFNVEGNPLAGSKGDYPGFIAIIEQVLPDQCTLVPDNDQQLTSDHGFDLRRDFDTLRPIVDHLKSLGVRVSLFMDPEPEQMPLVKALGADRIELYTGPFAWAFERDLAKAEEIFQRHCASAQRAIDLGLGVNAGHDLNLHNLRRYKELPGLKEVSIGHALTVDALLMGFRPAIDAYLAVCARPHVSA